LSNTEYAGRASCCLSILKRMMYEIIKPYVKKATWRENKVYYTEKNAGNHGAV